MTTYMICDGHGNQLTDGVSEHDIARTARRMANERGETVYVSNNDDSEAEDQAWEPEAPGLQATITERGNGLPDVGDYVPGDDGQLYLVTALHGSIQTGRPGQGNWIRADVELADWADCSERGEFPASVTVGEDAEERS